MVAEKGVLEQRSDLAVASNLIAKYNQIQFT